MGGRPEAITAWLGHNEDGSWRLDSQMLPGSGGCGPVITPDGKLAGFVMGRTDPLVDGGGADLFSSAL